MHTDARPSMTSHRYTHAYISTRTRTHEEMGCSRTQMGPRMHVCAPRHPYTPRGTSVDTDARCTDGHITAARAHTHAHMRTLPWNRFAHPYKYMYSYIRTQMYARSDTRLVGARVCRSRRARANARTHTHTYLHDIYTHIHMRIHALTHIHTW